MASDAVFFNSNTQLQQFKEALPKMIKQQAPPDSVDWHLQHADACIRDRCAVLPLGLSLKDLDEPCKRMYQHRRVTVTMVKSCKPMRGFEH